VDLAEAVIAFHADPDGRDDFYLIRADGSALQQITDGAETVAFPYWSPGGDRIAYLCCTGGSSALWVMNADGSDPTQLAPAPVGEPAWSPSGNEIAYASYADEAIWVVGADGASARRIAEQAGGPAWSPDGSRLAFFTWRHFPGQEQRNEIHTISADGSEERRLTENEVEDILPAWSPDGTRLAWISSSAGVPHVHLMNADGYGQQGLTDGPDLDDAPAWSPDGSRILFVRYMGGADPLMLGAGNAEIHTVTIDGAVTNLTNDPQWDGYPAWSPDGAWIAYGVNDGREFNLWVMRANGSDKRELPGVPSELGTTNDCCPAWQP
jgi:TolB protein